MFGPSAFTLLWWWAVPLAHIGRSLRMSDRSRLSRGVLGSAFPEGAAMSVDSDILSLDSGHVVVVPKGELDMAREADLSSLLEVALTLRSRVIVDMHAVEFMDCAALTVLIRASLEATSQGGWLTLVRIPPPTERLLSISKLDRFIATAGSVPDAIRQWEVFDIPRPLQSSGILGDRGPCNGVGVESTAIGPRRSKT
jgi:anti-anti-sigma factor